MFPILTTYLYPDYISQFHFFLYRHIHRMFSWLSGFATKRNLILLLMSTIHCVRENIEQKARSIISDGTYSSPHHTLSLQRAHQVTKLSFRRK